MKKIGLSVLLFLAFLKVKAQDKEIKINVFNTMAIGSVEVGYEYFVNENRQSLGLELLINDRFSYSREKGDKKFKTNSISASYNFYSSKENNGSGYVVSPFFKYRFGNYEERKTVNKMPNQKVKTNMNSVIFGLNFGYKWLFNGLSLSPYAGISRNFSDEVKNHFSVIEFNAGFSVGCRF